MHTTGQFWYPKGFKKNIIIIYSKNNYIWITANKGFVLEIDWHVFVLLSLQNLLFLIHSIAFASFAKPHF